ncbi:MAG: hypothetical protein JJ883_14350 [Thalassospira sp.]|nr:hypothetical protein [Thalassospira sp.]MBO6841659.1 hypothetical protein [Thalassospira sp.]
MSDIEILALAYQRRDAGEVGELSEIIAQVKTDLAAMQPPEPGPSDEIGFSSQVIGGVRKNYKIMGDGSMVEVTP